MPRLQDLIEPRSRPAQWSILIALSLVLATLFELAGLPAALLLGPMIGGILLASGNGRIHLPRGPFLIAQGLIGCMIARTITPPLLAEVLKDWPIFIGGVLSVILMSSLIGWVMARRQILPGTTAVWGSSPGAATAMVVMAEAYGGDMRLVALMQYLRVLMVAGTASLVARLWVGTTGAPPVAIVWFPPVDPAAFAATIAVVIASVVAGSLARIPAGALIMPLAVAIPLQAAGWLTIELPPWLLALSYAFAGWSIGLRFTRDIIGHAAAAMPRVIAAIALLILLCGGLALALSHATGLDLLTAYLATSPGGADSVAIIASGTHVDMPFVMAMQTMRFLVILLVGPPLARAIAARLDRLDRRQA